MLWQALWLKKEQEIYHKLPPSGLLPLILYGVPHFLYFPFYLWEFGAGVTLLFDWIEVLICLWGWIKLLFSLIGCQLPYWQHPHFLQLFDSTGPCVVDQLFFKDSNSASRPAFDYWGSPYPDFDYRLLYGLDPAGTDSSAVLVICDVTSAFDMVDHLALTCVWALKVQLSTGSSHICQTGVSLSTWARIFQQHSHLTVGYHKTSFWAPFDLL